MAHNDIQLVFDLDSLSEQAESLAPSWNVAPTQDIAIIVERQLAAEDQAESSSERHASAGEDGAMSHPAPLRELHVARWGFVPPWAKDPNSGPPMFNARIETIAEKRIFAPSLKKRRCIVPANGYFEWQATGSGKIPHFIHYEDGSPLAFAGLYGWWKTPDGTWLLSATIITKEAEGPMSLIHDRIPAIVRSEEYDLWLDPQLQDPLVARSIIEGPSPTLVADVVAKTVGNTRNNTPANIMPVAP